MNTYKKLILKRHKISQKLVSLYEKYNLVEENLKELLEELQKRKEKHILKDFNGPIQEILDLIRDYKKVEQKLETKIIKLEKERENINRKIATFFDEDLINN